MNTLSPLHDFVTTKLSELERRLFALENSRQPYLGDWFDFNPNDFSYNTANKINVPNFTPSNRFSLGDRLRIKLVGDVDYRYFFLTRNNSDTIEIEGGDNFVFTSTAISEIASAKIPNPTGFPGIESFVKSYDITAHSYAGSNTYTNTSKQYLFYMIGNQVNWRINYVVTVGGTVNAGGPTYLELVPPITRASGSDMQLLNGNTSSILLKDGSNPWVIAPFSNFPTSIFFADYALNTSGADQPFLFNFWPYFGTPYTYDISLYLAYLLKN